MTKHQKGTNLIMKLITILLFTLIFTSMAQDIILQQDVNGYTGCEDSYIDHSDFGPFNDMNHGDKDSIRTDVCYT